MTEAWHKTETDLDADEHAVDFWSRHREELQEGEFWADRIKKLRDAPEKRLALAIENLPLPASFREAAFATRALIRDKRKQKIEYEEELALLYWLAAVNSFSIPYSNVLKEPGYNVVESVPGKKLKGLPFSYKSLGYNKLELLNKTDVKWLSELWGEPEQHTTLHKMHNDVWREYECKLKAKRMERDEEFIKGINERSSSPAELPSSLNEPKGTNKVKWLIVAVVIGLLLAAVYRH
ncbi:hypothetical protein MHM95_01155 [Pseudoalteromonas sp. CnMc7-15]|uniref:hypothetical protein n=1 Tax=unclassified Pseudoalteromonas TaxID=194690 RepID=UPI001EF47EEE|nr:hypothetical protein [Pseudoalteromonas sp. CnMc7-15]MCG7564901.1 hypothetical protein [Pseudoalteromonas sp. CnMc7-15]